MENLESRFREAEQAVTRLSQRPDNNTLLKLYGLYKQATVGDAPAESPGLLDFTGRAKWEAWRRHGGKPVAQAQQEYIALVDVLRAMDEDD